MPRGRPREFALDAALDCALKMFWTLGYDGVTISALASAMGINRPSFYAAFGSKEQLFRQALDRYATRPGQEQLQLIEAAPTARDAMAAVLLRAVDLMTDPNSPSGCLLVQGSLCSNTTSSPIEAELVARRSEAEIAMRRRLHRAVLEGDLPADANIFTLAAYFSTVMQGMALRARAGGSSADLRSIAEHAVSSIPSPGKIGASADNMTSPPLLSSQ